MKLTRLLGLDTASDKYAFAVDPVTGYTAERRTERQLIVDFESTMAAALPALSASNHATLLEWVRVHDTIRGFGHVKAANLERARARWAEMAVGKS